MKGLVVSALCEFGREFERERFAFEGDDREAVLSALIREGVRGVFASERERYRDGVFG